MEKVISEKDLTISINAACDNLRNVMGWSDKECETFATNLKEKLKHDGWEIVKE